MEGAIRFAQAVCPRDVTAIAVDACPQIDDDWLAGRDGPVRWLGVGERRVRSGGDDYLERKRLASILAEVIAELVDTEVYRLWVQRVTTRYQWARVLVSNAVSVPLDSVIFVMVAFYGTMPTAVLLSIMLANVLIKGATTLVSLPLIYAVPERG